MTALIASGRLFSWIVAAMLLEGACLTILFRWRGWGAAPASLLPNLASGASLVLAMRLALGGVWWGYVSAAMLAALLFHLTDLRRIWIAPGGTGKPS